MSVWTACQRCLCRRVSSSFSRLCVWQRRDRLLPTFAVAHGMAVQPKAGLSRDMLMAVTRQALTTWPGPSPGTGNHD